MKSTFENKQLWLSYGVSLLIIILGSTAGALIHNYKQKQVITASSQLIVSGDTKILETTEQDLKAIIHENQKLVVLLQVKTPQGETIGSGFLYNDKGDVITNAHVVEGATDVTVKMADSTLYKGVVIGKSGNIDIALVRIQELAGKSPMKLGKDKKMETGDEVIAFGSPLGLENTVTTGIVSGIQRDFKIGNYQYKDMYQISAPISPGNSGGPLLDKKTGQVVGVNSAGVNGSNNIGFSIPIGQVLTLVENWSNNPSIFNDNNPVTQQQEQKITQENAKYLIRYFYESLSSKDYVTAYALLGSEWHGKTSYEPFRAGYLNTLDVRVKNSTSRQLSADRIEVTVIIEALEQINNVKQISQYKMNYEVGVENGAIKILIGQGEKI